MGEMGPVGENKYLVRDEGACHPVEPSARLDRVEAHDDHLELAVPRRLLVLDGAVVGGDAHALDAPHDKLGGDGRLGSAYVGLTEEELAVQVRHVDRIHVDHVDQTKAREREVFEQLAAETTGANDEDTRRGAHELEDGRVGLEWDRWLEDGPVVALIGHWPRARQQLAHVCPALTLIELGHRACVKEREWSLRVGADTRYMST